MAELTNEKEVVPQPTFALSSEKEVIPQTATAPSSSKGPESESELVNASGHVQEVDRK